MTLGIGLALGVRYNINMNFNRFKMFVFPVFLFLSVFSSQALLVNAQNSTSCTDGKICNPISTNTINEFIKVLLEGALKIGIPIIALAIIYAGFLFVTARGNSEKLSTAKDALLYTVIGAAILLGSWAIAKLISETVLQLN